MLIVHYEYLWLKYTHFSSVVYSLGFQGMTELATLAFFILVMDLGALGI